MTAKNRWLRFPQPTPRISPDLTITGATNMICASLSLRYIGRCLDVVAGRDHTMSSTRSPHHYSGRIRDLSLPLSWSRLA